MACEYQINTGSGTPVPPVWGLEFEESVRSRFGFCGMAKVRCLGCTAEVLSMPWSVPGVVNISSGAFASTWQSELVSGEGEAARLGLCSL